MEEIEPEEAPLVAPAERVRKRPGANPHVAQDLGRNGGSDANSTGHGGGDARIRAALLHRPWHQPPALFSGRRPCPTRRRLLLCPVPVLLFLLVADVVRNNGRVVYFRLWEYRLERFLKVMSGSEPNAALATTLATRRETVDARYHTHGRREDSLVWTHLDALQRDIGRELRQDSSVSTSASVHYNKTVVLLWSGEYPVWEARVTMGEVKGCNLPCEWTTDREYNAKHALEGTAVTAVACMLYDGFDGKDLCRDISPHTLREVGIEADQYNFPVLGITWENTWRGGYDYAQRPAGIDESVPSQLESLRLGVPYNLVASHELDAHIPVLYGDIADLVDRHEVSSMEELRKQQDDKAKMDSVYFAISNCLQSPLRPDRLKFISALGLYYPTNSYGKCLASSHNRAQSWNTRSNRGTDRTLEEMSRHRFVYVAENSYGMDYVTEKVYRALMSGSVPIYLGAPNVDAFLPDRDAVVYAGDFDSPRELGTYLWEVSRNVTLLAERHLKWRTRPLPERFLRLSKLANRKSDYSFACKVCNCVRGRIGCPKFADIT